MEHAPLRPLPSRPSRPADPKLARAYLRARLPRLDSEAADALALVQLSRVERRQAARELGLGEEPMGSALARGRKVLRRSRCELAGSGWCERAERMISDRLDGELASPARERLDAHLRNCPRCVEHELLLTQAIDALVDGMPAPVKPAAALRLVVPTVRALPPGNPPDELDVGPPEPELEAAPANPEPDPPSPALAPAPPARPLPEPEAPPALAPVPAPAPAAPPQAHHPEPPLPASPRPVAPRVLADPRPVSALITAFTWHIAFALALALTVATIAVTVIGIGGGSL